MVRKDRVYLFTVEVRVNGGWEPKQVKGTSMVEVSRELKIKLDDIRYITKEVVR